MPGFVVNFVGCSGRLKHAEEAEKGNTDVGVPFVMCPLEDSNLRTRLRRPVLYPLS